MVKEGRYRYFDDREYPIFDIGFNEVEEMVPFIIENHIQAVSVSIFGEKPCRIDYPWSLKPFEECNELKVLWIDGAFSDFYAIKNLKLDELSMECYQTRDRICLDDFPNLSSLSVLNYPRKTSGLENCNNLKWVWIDGYQTASDNLQAFSEKDRLKSMTLTKARISTLKGIEKCTSLEEIRIGYSRKLKSIGDVATLSNVRKLQIENCKNIEDFSCLKQMKSLEHVIISGCNCPKDLFLDREMEHVWID